MDLINKRITWIYFSLLILCVYSPTFQVYDKATAQYFWISLLNLSSLIILPFFIKKIELKQYIRHPFLLTFLGFITISILSMLKSINIIESLVRLGQLITFITALFIIIIFIKKNLLSVNLILILISLSLIIDMTFSLVGYLPFLFSNLDYTYDQNIRLVGLYGNRNILATIICFKIPFLILLAIKKRKKLLSILTFIIVTLAFFNISLLSSRATYLSIILSVIFLLGCLMYIAIKNRELLKHQSRLIVFYFVPLMIAFFMSNSAIKSDDEGAIVNRVSSITSTNDTSKNTRLRYYSHAIQHTLKNPFLGGGIGNWKILSIKYDAKNIANYIIPYNAHNDFLEAFAETGILGGILFLSFFLIMPYYLYNNLKNKILLKDEGMYSILIFIPFIVYFVDLNLNFPSSRPSNQVALLFYICLVLFLKSRINEK